MGCNLQGEKAMFRNSASMPWHRQRLVRIEEAHIHTHSARAADIFENKNNTISSFVLIAPCPLRRGRQVADSFEAKWKKRFQNIKSSEHIPCP